MRLAVGFWLQVVVLAVYTQFHKGDYLSVLLRATCSVVIIQLVDYILSISSLILSLSFFTCVAFIKNGVRYQCVMLLCLRFIRMRLLFFLTFIHVSG